MRYKYNRPRTYIDNPIYKIRQYFGLTQADLGLLVNRPKSAIARYETGESLPNRDTITELNKLLEELEVPELEVTIEDLVEWQKTRRRSLIEYYKDKSKMFRRLDNANTKTISGESE